MVVLFSLLLLGSLTEQSLEGTWLGSIEIPGSKLDFRIELDRDQEGAWVGKISIPFKQIRELPLTKITIRDDLISFGIEDVPGKPRFVGNVSENGVYLRGSFIQGGENVPFVMSRSAISRAARNALTGLDQDIEAALVNYNVPGVAVAVVAGDEVVLARGYGRRNLEDQSPVTSRTLFGAASAVKGMTAALLGTLVDEGALSWSDPVTKHLPGFRFGSEKDAGLTVQQLLTHRSGLPRHDLIWYNAPYSREDLITRLGYLPRNSDVGAFYQYNNLGYAVLGRLAGALTDGSWEDAMNTRLLEPLGMGDTRFDPTQLEERVDVAQGYRMVNDQHQRTVLRGSQAAAPGVALFSHVEDMARWLRFNLNGGRLGDQMILSRGTLRSLHSPRVVVSRYPRSKYRQMQSYGYGWFVESYRGHYRVYHPGNIDGFTAQVSLLPLDNFAVVVMANQENADLPELLVYDINDRLLGLAREQWLTRVHEVGQAVSLGMEAPEPAEPPRKRRAKHAHNLKEYAGAYRHPAYGRLEVTLTDGKPAISYHDIVNPLEHWHYEMFRVDPQGETTRRGLWLQFQTDIDGFVSGLTINLERQVEPLVFEKLPDARWSEATYLQNFTGAYRINGRIMRVAQDGNSLRVSFGTSGGRLLRPAREDVFTWGGGSTTRLEFIRDETGEVIQANVHGASGTSVAPRID